MNAIVVVDLDQSGESKQMFSCKNFQCRSERMDHCYTRKHAEDLGWKFFAGPRAQCPECKDKP